MMAAENQLRAWHWLLTTVSHTQLCFVKLLTASSLIIKSVGAAGVAENLVLAVVSPIRMDCTKLKVSG